MYIYTYNKCEKAIYMSNQSEMQYVFRIKKFMQYGVMIITALIPFVYCFAKWCQKPTKAIIGFTCLMVFGPQFGGLLIPIIMNQVNVFKVLMIIFGCIFPPMPSLMILYSETAELHKSDVLEQLLHFDTMRQYSEIAIYASFVFWIIVTFISEYKQQLFVK